jgi:hypothetical protein
MVTRLVITLALLATVAQGQQVWRRVLRPDLGTLTNGTGEVAAWNFNGGELLDNSGSGNTPVTNGSVAYVSSPVRGYKITPASTTWITTAGNVADGSNMTLLVMSHRLPSATASFILGSIRGATGGWWMQTYSNQLQFTSVAGGASPMFATATDNRSIVSAFTKDTTSTFYENGQLRISSNLSFTASAAAPFRLGSSALAGTDQAASRIWSGVYQSAKLYNRSLSGNEIKCITFSRRPTQ